MEHNDNKALNDLILSAKAGDQTAFEELLGVNQSLWRK